MDQKRPQQVGATASMEPTAYRYREVHILLHPTGPYRKAVDPLSTRKFTGNNYLSRYRTISGAADAAATAACQKPPKCHQTHGNNNGNRKYQYSSAWVFQGSDHDSVHWPRPPGLNSSVWTAIVVTILLRRSAAGSAGLSKNTNSLKVPGRPRSSSSLLPSDAPNPNGQQFQPNLKGSSLFGTTP
ncbi:predicted protein [Histoplasma capsulatum G186AR]|uniref:Uncharacterized protein n=1 Tax=Ajellomyces capsulatus (strain G186AR / H82 / ATCC MYA-2454 / RMSCC 2432) TaxID=447093 RepID=C0NGU6_AJECG|nr:uncharacterized protein HCBG_02568 [Histoplasma capsulatum G186AR]EEH09031.1 predicted protein [Histoplasma capsulatum G186AR]